MLEVTRPFLPPKDEYDALLKEIWDINWLTNNGPKVQSLEQKIAEYLGIDNVLFLTNGTVAIQLAIKALDLRGEIITTPFSYVATTSSIVWENCQPVFADIDPDTFTLSPESAEALIGPNTTAILATHVFGTPCDVLAIEKLAVKHNLKVIYDGAHTFGVKVHGRDIFEFGDVSTTSFHATKIFHTVEGGACFAKDDEIHQRMKFMRNFGHNGPDKFAEVGINAKNSEFHAAMGLVNLKYMDQILARRKHAFEFYRKELAELDFRVQKIPPEVEYNYAYYPVVFKSEAGLLKAKEALAAEQIGSRRYFYPNLDQLPYTEKADIPHSDYIATRVLCLPFFSDITEAEIKRVAACLKRVGNA
jgi:dTDP-4-amino-4,6-dideoxygalactose transaminase